MVRDLLQFPWSEYRYIVWNPLIVCKICALSLALLENYSQILCRSLFVLSYFSSVAHFCRFQPGTAMVESQVVRRVKVLDVKMIHCIQHGFVSQLLNWPFWRFLCWYLIAQSSLYCMCFLSRYDSVNQELVLLTWVSKTYFLQGFHFPIVNLLSPWRMIADYIFLDQCLTCHGIFYLEVYK